MREDDFRQQFRGALGEPPHLSNPVLGRPAVIGPRLYPRGVALIAAILAIALVVALVGSRVTRQPRGNVVPGATPNVQNQLALDSLPCHLAVTLIQEADNPGQSSTSVSMGFVNIPSGQFYVDPQARVSDLPGGSTTGPDIYSAALSRWLPAFPHTLSPDATSYAYVKLLPAGADYSDATGGELHVVNGATRTDKALWKQGAAVEIVDWTSAGILASTVPLNGGVRLLWHIDPATGAASRAPDSEDPTFFTPSGYPGMHNFNNLGGPDSSGRSIFYLGSRDASTKYYVVLVEAGNATTIFSGTVGDTTHFDPSGFFVDAHGIWFGNIDLSRVWLWTQAAGLKSFAVSGQPAAPTGYQFTSSTFMPAGPCVPGQFQGIAAVGLAPATTPTPSPTPSPVDWTPLLAKPLTLKDLSPGAACPVSPQVTLKTKAPPGNKGGINYGYGNGPVYLSGQIDWYSGSQGAIVETDPAYSGPVLVRVKRLDGSGSIAFTGEGDRLQGGALGIRQTSSPPYWGEWSGAMDPSSPGCYGIQFDGTTFSDYAVIEVKQGPAPPG